MYIYKLQMNYKEDIIETCKIEYLVHEQKYTEEEFKDMVLEAMDELFYNPLRDMKDIYDIRIQLCSEHGFKTLKADTTCEYWK